MRHLFDVLVEILPELKAAQAANSGVRFNLSCTYFGIMWKV